MVPVDLWDCPDVEVLGAASGVFRFAGRRLGAGSASGDGTDRGVPEHPSSPH